MSTKKLTKEEIQNLNGSVHYNKEENLLCVLQYDDKSESFVKICKSYNDGIISIFKERLSDADKVFFENCRNSFTNIFNDKEKVEKVLDFIKNDFADKSIYTELNNTYLNLAGPEIFITSNELFVLTEHEETGELTVMIIYRILPKEIVNIEEQLDKIYNEDIKEKED